MPKMQPVFSSRVDMIGHDPETGELHVQWARGGKTSVYHGVDAGKAKMVMNSASVGSSLREHVENQHKHSYLGDTDAG